jgi:transposase
MSGSPFRRAGIDVGAKSLHLAFSYAKTDPIHTIDLTDPLWLSRLLELFEPGDWAALEPTGWHYAAPIMQALDHAGVRVLIVEHRMTQKIRDLKVSGIKNDRTDAKALAYLAHHHDQEQFLGVSEAKPKLQAAAMGLRMMIHAYMRADKERTRAKNRIRQLAHSQSPTLAAYMTPYLHAVERGYGTPAALHYLATWLQSIDSEPRRRDRVYPDGYKTPGKRAALYELAGSIAPWQGNEVIAEVIAEELDALRAIEERAERLRAQVESIAVKEPFGEITSLWLSMPNVGLLLCAMLHGATRGLAAHMTPEQFRASVGSHPRVSASGVSAESIRAAGGFRPAKRMLYLCEMSLIQAGNNPVAAVFAHHKARGEKYAMQKARAKLVNILSGIARSGHPYDPSRHGFYDVQGV